MYIIYIFVAVLNEGHTDFLKGFFLEKFFSVLHTEKSILNLDKLNEIFPFDFIFFG